MLKNITIDPRLLKIRADELHGGYLGESVLIAADDQTQALGTLMSFRMDYVASEADDDPAIRVVVRVGRFKLELAAGDQILFTDRFEKI